ncbi:MAG: hypothetical protein F6K39_45950 [Okeania sp. SIO3B3]|nr:hypothetical protein [Okeania sp. SIO3B3]
MLIILMFTFYPGSSRGGLSPCTDVACNVPTSLLLPYSMIKGRALKAINTFYNKQRSCLQSQLQTNKNKCNSHR